jgi:hypothetical protein
MSGGTFDYIQYRLDDIIERLEEEITENPQNFSNETITEFKQLIYVIKAARIGIHRVDYLLAYDDDEASFHRRLEEDLNNLE